MDTTPVPSLSTDGWVMNTPMKADLLLTHFFLSDYSRSYLNHGYVSSLPWLLHEYKDNPIALQENTKTTLERYFGAYFPKVVVEVKAALEDDGKGSMTFVIIVTDHENKEFSLAKIVDVIDSKVHKYQQLNNYGVRA